MVLTLTARGHLLSRWCAITCWVRQPVVMWVMWLANNNFHFLGRSQHLYISFLTLWLQFLSCLHCCSNVFTYKACILCMYSQSLMKVFPQNLVWWTWFKVNYSAVYSFHLMGYASFYSFSFMLSLTTFPFCRLKCRRKCEVKESQKTIDLKVVYNESDCFVCEIWGFEYLYYCDKICTGFGILVISVIVSYINSIS